MILCVDGSSFLHRQKYVAGNFTAEPTWMLYTYMFMRSLMKEYRDLGDFTSIVVTWDKGQCTHRTNLYPPYKESRFVEGELTDEYLCYVEARQFLHERLPTIGIRSVLIPGVEADDIAFYISNTRESGAVVSDDWDWLQCLKKEGWCYYRPIQKKKYEFVDFVDEYGDNPQETFRWYKAIKGDPSDDIPGVRGLGYTYSRKFAKMLTSLGIDDTLSSVGSGKYATLLKTNIEDVQLYYKLVDMSWILQDKDVRDEIEESLKPHTNTSQISWLSFCGHLEDYDLSTYNELIRSVSNERI